MLLFWSPIIRCGGRAIQLFSFSLVVIVAANAAAAAPLQLERDVWRAPRVVWPRVPQVHIVLFGRRRVLLECHAVAADPFDYRWYVDGRPLADDKRFDDTNAVLLANGSLELSDPRDGEFACVAANAWGASVSAPQQLRTERFEPPATDPAPVAVVADSERPLLLNCSGFENTVPQPDVFWALERHFGEQLEIEYLLLDGEHLLVDSASRLVIVNPSPVDQTAVGEHYACVMRSKGSRAGLAVLQRYSLAVTEAEEMNFEAEPLGLQERNATNDVIAVKGKPLCLQCFFGGRLTQTIQWFHSSKGSDSPRPVWPRGPLVVTFSNELMLRKRSSEPRDADPFLVRVSTELERSGGRLDGLEGVERGPLEPVTFENAPSPFLLRVENPQPADAGSYECRATRWREGRRVVQSSVFYDVRLESAPEWLENPGTCSEVPVPLRANVTLECAARSRPSPTAVWFVDAQRITRDSGQRVRVNNGSDLAQAIAVSVRHVQRGDRDSLHSSLHVAGLAAGSSFVAQCDLANAHGVISHAFFVRSDPMRAEILLVTPQSLRAHAGAIFDRRSSVTLLGTFVVIQILVVNMLHVV